MRPLNYPGSECTVKALKMMQPSKLLYLTCPIGACCRRVVQLLCLKLPFFHPPGRCPGHFVTRSHAVASATGLSQSCRSSPESGLGGCWPRGDPAAGGGQPAQAAPARKSHRLSCSRHLACSAVCSLVSPASAQPLRCPLPLLEGEMNFSRALLPSGGQALLLLPESQAAGCYCWWQAGDGTS